MIFNIKDIRDIVNYNYIGRSKDSLLGNPFIIGRDGNRGQVIEKFREYALGTPRVLQAIAGLDERPLVCHCRPLKCHGDVILELKEKIHKGEIFIPNIHKLAVVGCRYFTNYELFSKYLNLAISRLDLKFDTIVSGGAKGVDSMAEKYANENMIYFKKYEADWNGKGKVAGFIRNSELVFNSTYMIAFWDYKSSGTFDAICKSKQFNRETHIINIGKLK